MKIISMKDLRFPKRRKDSHKGENGRVLVIGGSPEYPGAIALAGLAALRSGADLVRVAAPEKVAWTVNSLTPDLITIKMKGTRLGKGHIRKLLELSGEADSVLIGNGMGRCPWVRGFIRDCRRPLVIDADALKEIEFTDARQAILTPHRAEFERLCSNSGIGHSEEEARKKLGDNLLIIKGREDLIISKEGSYKNRTGNDRMAVGGTGDVLAGLCAGFLAQGLSSLESAIDAVYINGRAGDKLLSKKGYSFLASDLAEDNEKMIKKLGKQS